MDLFTIVGASMRRWYVTVPVLALAVFGAYKAYESVPSVYTSSVSIAVLPAAPAPVAAPATKGSQATAPPENPYAGSGGPRFAAAVLARNINNGTYKNQIGLGKAANVSFTATASTTQPMIRIDATGPSGPVVLDTLSRVTGQAGVVLNDFQTTAGAPEQTLYRLAVAVPADTVTDVTPSRWRNAGALIALGLAAAATLATALDVAMRRRRPTHSRAAAKAGPDAEPADESAADEDERTDDQDGDVVVGHDDPHEDGVAERGPLPVVFPARLQPVEPSEEETDREPAVKASTRG
jgi:hypothetical protein